MGADSEARGFEWWGWKTVLVLSVWRRYVFVGRCRPVTKDTVHSMERMSVFSLTGLPIEEGDEFVNIPCSHVGRISERMTLKKHDRECYFGKKKKEKS